VLFFSPSVKAGSAPNKFFFSVCVAPHFLPFGVEAMYFRPGCVVVMPHTLCALGSTTNDRGERGPFEPVPANQINPGS
jgi:hypothetical protein